MSLKRKEKRPTKAAVSLFLGSKKAADHAIVAFQAR
jgi:hypothetical protein